MMAVRWRIALLAPLAASLAMWPLVGLAQETPITASVDRAEVAVDDVFTLTVTVNGSADIPTPPLPSMEGVDVNVLSRSTSSQLSIFNGRTSAQVVSHYRLQATSPGTLDIGPMLITVDGQTYRTDPIVVKVLSGAVGGSQAPRNPNPAPAPGRASVAETFFVDAEVDNPTPYVGQQVDYIFRFYSALGFVSQPRYEAPAFTGFWHQEGAESRRYSVSRDDRRYGVIELRTALFPTVAGTVTIGPTRFSFPGAGFRPSRQLSTGPVTVNVRPLPPGAPADFDGAVGKLDISASVDVASAAVNDPVTLTVVLSGPGNMETLPDPVLPDLAGWRAFDGPPSVSTQVVDGKMMGKRSLDRIYVPTAEGVFTIPPITYSYFDPDAERYQTVSTDPITVSITPGRVEAPTSQQAGRDQVERVALDIRHIMPAPASLEQPKTPIVERPLYWAAWALPLLAVLAGAGWKGSRSLKRNAEAARGAAARRRAMLALDIARQQEDDPHDVAARVLASYIAERLGRPVSGLTHHALARLLAGRGVDGALVERVETYLVDSERVRFAPGSGVTGSGEEVLDETAKLVAELERFFV